MNKKTNQMMLNVIASVIVFIVQIVIDFWLTPFVIAKLGEQAYGFISMVSNFTQYAALLTVAINSMASRFISYEYNKGNKEKANVYFASVFWMNALMSMIILIASVAIVYRLEFLVNIDSVYVKDVKIAFLLSFVNMIIGCLSTCFTATTFVTNRMDFHAYIQIFSNLLKVVLVVGSFLILKPHIFYLSASYLVCSLAVMVVYIFLQKKLLTGFRLNIKYVSFETLIPLIKAGVWILVSDLSSILLNGMDVLLANIFISEIAMSRLAISKQIPTAIGSLLGVVGGVFTASFTLRVAGNQRDKLIEEVNDTIKWLGFFLTVPFAGIIVFGRDFLSLWLPQELCENVIINQIYVLMMLTLANVIINAYMYCLHSLLIALNKVRFYSLLILASSFISIIATLLLLKFTSLGVYAIAGTSTVVLCLINLFVVPMYAARVTQLGSFGFFGTIFKSHSFLVILSAMFYVIHQVISIERWLTFFVTILLVGAVGYVFCFCFMLDRESRRKIIKSVLK